MTQVAAMFSDHSVIFYDEQFNSYEAHDSNPAYAELLEELKSPNPDLDKCIGLTKPIIAVQNAVNAAVEGDYLAAGVVSVTKNEIRYNGEIVEGALVNRILWMLSQGFDIMPMVRFMENLFTNPSDIARDELYLWLESSDLPITADGHFLAYKRVNANFTSIHDGKTMNVPGTFVQMKRVNVDPVRDNTCSRGLHFCSKSYLPNFGSNGNGFATLILKVNPAEVVSIPSDYSNAKGRAWKYEVLKVVEGDPETMVWPAVTTADGDVYVVDNPADEPGYVNPFNDYRLTDEWADEDDVDDDDFEDDDEPEDVDLGPLFAAYNQIAADRTDRQARLNWASLRLFDVWGGVESFSQLNEVEVQTLTLIAEEELALREDAATEAAHAAAEAARAAQIAAINSYGIITLRRLTGKWKGSKAQDLRNELISRIV